MMKTNLIANLEAGRLHAQTLAAPAAPIWPAAGSAKPINPSVSKSDPRAGLVQFNVRLEPTLRHRIRAAAMHYRMTEQELLTAWAKTLPALTPAPKFGAK
jgi:hypothetical protein